MSPRRLPGWTPPRETRPATPTYRVLVVEPDGDHRAGILECLRGRTPHRFEIEWADDLAGAEARLRNDHIDAVILDVAATADPRSGLDLVRSMDPPRPLIVLSAPDTLPSALEAYAAGADDIILTSELRPPRVATAVERAIRTNRAVTQMLEDISRYRHLIEDHPDGILAVAPNETILYGNASAARMLGRPIEELMGSEFGYPLGVPGGVETTLVRPDGTTVPAEMRSVEMHWGNETAHLVAFRDISERIELEEERRRRFEQEARARQFEREADFKTHLINRAAHQISTPLTPIIIQLGLMLRNDDELDPDTWKRVQTIERNVTRLRRLANELATVASVSMRIDPEDPGSADLADIAIDVAERVVHDLDDRSVRVDIDIDPGTRVRLGRDWLDQALHALVENAVKACPDGGAVQVSADVEDGLTWIRVSDNGRGIAPDQLEEAFAPFTTLHTPDPGEVPGSGLGLYIVREIAARANGRVWGTSPGPGQGATFILELPLSDDPNDGQTHAGSRGEAAA